MKLCVFCGTFNPIHNVHLALANYIKTHFKFDTILFIPAYKPPHKHIDDDLANHRYAMVKLAIDGVSGFNISNIEFRHERFSYTVNTMEELYKMFPAIEGKISFIIGTDAFRQIEDWYETDRLKELVDFVVFPREDNFKPESLERFRNAGYNFICVDMPFINLSSTVLRSRIKHGKPIGNLVPQKVQELLNPKTFHSPAGAYVAKTEFGVEDEEILSAIYCHTVGKLNMTTFEKIIFLADKIEPNTRDKSWCEKVYKILNEENGLDKALMACYDYTIKSLVDRRLKICLTTIKIYNELLDNIKA